MEDLFPEFENENKKEFWDGDSLRWDWPTHIRDKDAVTLVINNKYNDKSIGERKRMVMQCMAFKELAQEFRGLFSTENSLEPSEDMVKMVKDLKGVYLAVIDILYKDGLVPVRDKSKEMDANKNNIIYMNYKLPWGPHIIATESEVMVFIQRQKRLKWRNLMDKATAGGNKAGGNEAGDNGNDKEEKEEEDETTDNREVEGGRGRGRDRDDPRNKRNDENHNKSRSRSRNKGRRKKKRPIDGASEVPFNIDDIDNAHDRMSTSAV